MLVTTAAPTAPGDGRSGTTRRTTTQPGTTNRIGQTRTTEQRDEPCDDRPAEDQERGDPDRDDGRRARAGAGTVIGRGFAQRDDDSDHDRADDPARRPRRVLRGGRAARPPRAARPAGHRRRRGRRGRAGVVSAASYEARRFGVHSAMSLREAYRRCPDGVFLPVDGRRYQQASRDVMAILRRFTPLVEPISIDEAFLDVTGFGGAVRRRPGDRAGGSRTRSRAEVGLTASVGVATTKLVAKIASDLRKPDGLVVVPAGEEAAFLAPLPIGRLWGVGEKTATALAEYGVRTIGDLAALPAGPRRAAVRQARRVARRAGARDRRATRSTTATRRSRSATSTRSTSTRPTRRSSSGPCSAMADGVAGPAPVGRRQGRHDRGQDPRQRRSGRSPASGPWPSRPT